MTWCFNCKTKLITQKVKSGWKHTCDSCEMIMFSTRHGEEIPCSCQHVSVGDWREAKKRKEWMYKRCVFCRYTIFTPTIALKAMLDGKERRLAYEARVRSRHKVGAGR